MKLKTLIVDDEPVARKVLREDLEGMDEIEIIGEADSGAAALNQIAKRQPDLVLLDLQMPGMSGFEVIAKLRGGPHVPVIVIVTAYDKHALEAFEAGAIDYLLKPVRQERLEQTIERVRRFTERQAIEQLARLQEIGGASPTSQRLRKVVGKAGAEYFLLNTDEIYSFQAEGDIVWIFTARQKFLATQTLDALEQRLRDTHFQRIHRNALVNVDHVRKISHLSSQRWLLTMNNDQEYIASKRRARGLRQLLQ
ncbi:MAG TPA: LytTR family DNA-binding domain-containing protein [Bryobacteraceae bacterium]|nr:LytTR family DNA-binding domain-containing protein [Bryobacteraceae bacterium]